MDILQSFLTQQPTGRVLDIATGRGGFIQAIREQLSTYSQIVGIDVTFKSLLAAQNHFADPKIQFVPMSADSLGFPDHSFDIVTISNSLHHLPDLPKAIKEIERVLKPGGYWIVMEMYCDGQTETQSTHVRLHHWWAAVDTAMSIPHRETMPRQELVQLLANSGISGWKLEDQLDVSSDPLDPALLTELDGIINIYNQRAEKTSQAVELIERGENLRQRVHQIGFHSATELIAIGQKQKSA